MSCERRRRPHGRGVEWRLASVTAISASKSSRRHAANLLLRASVASRSWRVKRPDSGRGGCGGQALHRRPSDGWRQLPGRRSDEIPVAGSDRQIRLQHWVFAPPAAPARGPGTVHPDPLVACEHMFPSWRTSALAQQALSAFRLTRSFLLLEDDDRVDWEVDGGEPADARPSGAPLREGICRRRTARQRPGQPPAAPQVCALRWPLAQASRTHRGRSSHRRDTRAALSPPGAPIARARCTRPAHTGLLRCGAKPRRIACHLP